ncbi:MAG: hypothetical protein AUK63_273 [bacterium P3]|nr:MAG: hypothetical protein AUK63_273 [bacterium P3]KWW42766.1 MAG: hypothetical protein F083_170 [bacterium F083]
MEELNTMQPDPNEEPLMNPDDKKNPATDMMQEKTTEISENEHVDVPKEQDGRMSGAESGSSKEDVCDTPAETETAPEAPVETETADAGEGDMEGELEGEATEDDAERFATMGREELVAALEALLQQEVQQVKHQVTLLRSRFGELTQEAERANYEAFLAGGGLKEDFQSVEDAVSAQFRKLYGVYRERRQRYQEAMEAQKRQNLAQKQQILEELRQLIERDEESLKATYDRFNEIQDKWKEIGEVPRESLNDLWQTYHFLIEQFFSKVKISKELRMLDLKRNLEQKMALCEKAEELMMEESVTKAFKELQVLRDRWREIGPVPTEHNEEIWQRFCNAANQVDERRKAYYEERSKEMEQNLLAKQALVAQVQAHTAERPQGVKGWNEVTATLDELLKMWKTIGPVPREANEKVWNEFKGGIDAFYRDKKAFFSQMRDEQTENYNRKIDLCLKAEAIAKREDWKKATEELLALQEEWKQVGNVSRKVSEKVWKRFRTACDEFFAKKNEFFKDIRQSEKENLAKKEAIIEQLKAFEFGEDKEENLRVIKDFQRQWMEAGHVPMREKERLQKEFRAVIDGHFERLKISLREAQETAFRERVDRIRTSGGRMSGERMALTEQIEKLRNNLKVWENNLGFLASSKQADLLRQEFERKLQDARQQLALLQAKLKILDEAEKEQQEKQA